MSIQGIICPPRSTHVTGTTIYTRYMLGILSDELSTLVRSCSSRNNRIRNSHLVTPSADRFLKKDRGFVVLITIIAALDTTI